MVELGRKVSFIEPATVTPAQPETQPIPQTVEDQFGQASGDGDASQGANSTRSSSSATSLTVIRQTEHPSLENGVYHEQIDEIEVRQQYICIRMFV